jgi:hypothetical protein
MPVRVTSVVTGIRCTLSESLSVMLAHSPVLVAPCACVLAITMVILPAAVAVAGVYSGVCSDEKDGEKVPDAATTPFITEPSGLVAGYTPAGSKTVTWNPDMPEPVGTVPLVSSFRTIEEGSCIFENSAFTVQLAVTAPVV